MIKKATSKDLIVINEIFKVYFNHDITRDIFTKIYIYYTNKIIGFISYSIIYERAELNYIAVLEQYQNNKVATELMNYMIEDVKNLDCISLEVNVNNIKAIHLYKKYGFKVVATRKNYYHNCDAYLMVRKKG